MLSRRRFVLSLAATGLAGPALAQTDHVTRGVVDQLQAQGFVIVDLRRTLLGRVRILARRGNLTRELVLDPRNGAILRDFVDRDGEGADVPDIGDYDEFEDEDEEDDDDDDEEDDDEDDDRDDDDDGSDDDDDDDD